MRWRILFLSLVCAICLMTLRVRLQAQEPASSESISQRVAAEDERASTERWKLVNTAIFVILIGFAVMRYGPRFFQARSLDIQKAIKDATGLKIEADFRYSEIDKKMANLASEVERMKAEAAAEMDREHQRVRRETAEEVQHIDRHADSEIDTLRSEGSLQVRYHTAQLALALADRRLQSHFSQAAERNNIGEFVDLVGSDKGMGSKN